MRLFCLAVAISAVVSSAAHAEGLRAEIHGGYQRLSNKTFFSPSDTTFRPVEGGTYGLGIGYDLPIGDKAFAGLEANADFSTGSRCQVNPLVAFVAPGIFESCLKPRRDLSAIARVGVQLGSGGTRAYVLGGYSNLRLESYSQINRSAPTGLTARNRDGFRIGAGLEQSFGDRVYGKLEYRYSNYGQSINRSQGLVGIGIRF